MDDNLRTLLFEEAACRAQLVHLRKSWQIVSSHNQYPKAVVELLGQLVAASTLLSASLKFEGSLVLQIQGDGPIKLLVAECNNTLGIRATVKLVEEASIADEASFTDLVNRNGKGLCVLILDPKNRLPGQQPYQGVVGLDGINVAQVLEEYMRHSEQLKTRIQLWSDAESAAGIMIQEMPRIGGKTSKEHLENGWETLMALSGTATSDEMLRLGTEEMSKRLFSELQPQILADRQPHFQCTCSRTKVSRMLTGLGLSEITDALKEHPNISVHCDFCNAAYVFTQNQCEALFSNDDELDPVPDEIDPEANPADDIFKQGSPPTLH